MKRLIVNIILFFVAVILLSTIGVFGLIYSVFWTVFNFKKVSFLKYWIDLIFSINIGIDQIGNVLLSTFLNSCCTVNKSHYPFGNVDHTISHVLAINYFDGNLTRFGKMIVKILETIDKNHMYKSLKQHS
jgi:hypothetical protein